MTKVQERIVMERKVVESFIQRKSHNQIAKTLGISKKRIKVIRGKAKKYGYIDVEVLLALPPYPETLFPDDELEKIFPPSESESILLKQKSFIEDRFTAGWTPITIYEEMNFKTSLASFYRFVKKYKLNEGRSNRCRMKVVSEIIHKPGDALLLDWGLLRHVHDPITNKKRSVWFLAGVLGHSRYMAVRLVWSNSVEETMTAIESIFNELGGVPERIISDNPKCFATTASKYEPILNPAMERFASYYGVILECLPPYDPEKKGKVERLVPYIRRIFEAHGEKWNGLENAQKYLDKKVEIANERIHGTTRLRPIDIFLAEECSLLKSLPRTTYEREEYSEAKVRRDGHVRFSNKYYSLEEQYIGKDVVIIANSNQLTIFCNGKMIETHNRITNPHQSKSTKEMHLREEFRNLENNKPLIEKAKKIGPNVEELVKAIVIQGRGFIDTRKIWGILSLDKKFPHGRIDSACKNALDTNELSYQYVLRFLNLKLSPENKIENYVPESKPIYGRDITEYKKTCH